MNYAQLHYILPKQRTARKSSVEGHRDKLTADLAQWQEQIARDNGAPVEDVTVIVSEAGSYVAHIGPWTFYRKAATQAAGIKGTREHTYYEQVRDEVERLAECTTSDAQGIIGAWERTNGQSIEEDTFGEAEQAGTDPEQLARTILNMPAPPSDQGATPGPWEVTETGENGEIIEVMQADGPSIATMIEGPHMMADARLMAASPRLLKTAVETEEALGISLQYLRDNLQSIWRTGNAEDRAECEAKLSALDAAWKATVRAIAEATGK